MSFADSAASSDPNLNSNLAAALDGSSHVTSASVGSSVVWAVPDTSANMANVGEIESSGGIMARPASVPDGLRFLQVTVIIGARKPAPMLTNAATVPDLLQAMGVQVRRYDILRPGPDTMLSTGMRVRVIRIRRVVRTMTVSTPFRTLIQYSKDLLAGQVNISTLGQAGQSVETLRLTFRNGKEVDREVLTEVVVTSPIDQVEIHSTEPDPGVEHGTQTGQASWYDCPTDGMYAAHLTIPKGTKVTVTDVDSGETVTVIINDRGPYGVAGRIIDLCSSAFAALAPLGQGVANVSITW
jgi:hypothetical protein